MSGLIDKRKRSREDDLYCESTPLSKRINNLHLTPNSDEAAVAAGAMHTKQNHHHHAQQQNLQQQQHNQLINNNDSNHHNYNNNDVLMPKIMHQTLDNSTNHGHEQQPGSLADMARLEEAVAHHHHHHQQQQHHEQQHYHQHYRPEMDEAENPYYYIKNKLLHELHLERLKRCPV